jgi:hypothetical protein
MEAEVDDSSCSEADQVPAVKVRGVQHRVLGQQQQGLYLSHVSRCERPVSRLKSFSRKADAILVMLVVDNPALCSGSYGDDHVEKPKVRVFDDTVISMIEVIHDGQ